MSQSLISILLSENFVVLSKGGPFGPMFFTSRAFGVEGAREGLKGSFETVWALPPRNIYQKYGYHCWWRTCLGPFLAKTSRTAVLTAIMDLSAGGRLYKCLYKMHVDSRAFWGAFWGAFRVFLIDSPG